VLRLLTSADCREGASSLPPTITIEIGAVLCRDVLPLEEVSMLWLLAIVFWFSLLLGTY